jgi:hypothetical protein
MNQPNRAPFEKRVLAASRKMKYPRTPEIASSVRARMNFPARPPVVLRRPAWSLILFVILASSLMLIPPARAAILEFIRVGVVRIFPRPAEGQGTPLPAPETLRTALPSAGSSTLTFPLGQISGERTLSEAAAEVEFPLSLPTYPADLGRPGHVFVQEADGRMVILVWTDPEHAGRVLMSLHFIPPGSWAMDKLQPTIVQETTVDGRPAVWATGPYILLMKNGDLEFLRLIDGHVLIWSDENLTYRLETTQSLGEALETAESLEPYPGP